MSETESKIKSPLLEIFGYFEAFSRCMLDAYIVVNTEGKVEKNNQMFSMVCGKKAKQIQKAVSLDELIEFKSDGKPLKVKDLLLLRSPTRFDEVAGTTEVQKDMNLILGFYPFMSKENELLGFFLLIRDVTAETNLQGKYKDKATQSVTDKLTGLYNRAYFETFLPELIKNALSTQGSAQGHLSLVMSDIDHFKKINDNYGHQAGDFVLEKVSEIFKENYRTTDTMCRYGGEEFLVILPSAHLTDAELAANRTREAIAKYVFDFNGTIIPVHISMGVAEWIFETSETPEQLISRADAALYHAKEHGRNRVCKSLKDKKIE